MDFKEFEKKILQTIFTTIIFILLYYICKLIIN